MIKGVIFDFNGTLFWDHDINHRAWINEINEIAKGKVDAEQFYLSRKSIPNNQLLTQLHQTLGLQYDKELLDKCSNDKEAQYQKIAIDENRNKLIAGAEELFDYLNEKQLPFNIATSSIDTNVDFYFSNFGLDRWFGRYTVAYDDGTVLNKVEMYKKAARNIGVAIEDCLVFEDSLSALDDAIKAGCNNIVHVNTRNTKFDRQEIVQVIDDFNEFDRSLLETL